MASSDSLSYSSAKMEHVCRSLLSLTGEGKNPQVSPHSQSKIEPEQVWAFSPASQAPCEEHRVIYSNAELQFPPGEEKFAPIPIQFHSREENIRNSTL